MRERLITLKPDFLDLPDQEALDLVLLRRQLRRAPPEKVLARKRRTNKKKTSKPKADPLANLRAITAGMTPEQKAKFLDGILNP